MAGPTYRIDEITRRTGFTARAVRYYVQRGLLPPTPQHGVATVYSHEQLLRLLAITLLRTRERLRLEAVKRRLAKMSLADIEALVATMGGVPGLAADPIQGPTTEGVPAATGATDASATLFALWRRAELLPGLLAVRADAAPVVRRLADEIFAKYGATAAPLASGG